MDLPLNYDLRSMLYPRLGLSGLRSARLVCRGLHNESQDAFYDASLRDQFEQAPAVTKATPKETFVHAFKQSEARAQRFLAHRVPVSMWREASIEAPALAATHRLAVAEAFWKGSEARLSAGKTKLLPEIESLLKILPAQVPSPLYAKALAFLHEATKSKIYGGDAQETQRLKTLLMCGAALSEG